MVQPTLEKIAEIAEARKKELDASVVSEGEKSKEKKEPEPMAAGEEDEKGEGSKPTLEDAEKQAAEDERILAGTEEELSEEDKSRKAEILKLKEEKERKEEAALSVDDKIKRTKEETQRRIDEVISDLKAERSERERDKNRISELQSELAELKAPAIKEDKQSKTKQLFNDRIASYLEEDKSKPYEDRREMSKADLEEWLSDDYVAASEWISDRSVRRAEERREIRESVESVPKALAKEFVDSQQSSLKKLVTKYPSLIPTPVQIAAVKGKSREEAEAILSEGNPDYAMMVEIVRSDPKTYVELANAPELVMAEMDKRKSLGNGKKVISLTEEELQARIQTAAQIEAQRLSGIDEGITSSGGKKKVDVKNKTEFRMRQEAVAKRAGISTEQLEKRLKERDAMGVKLTVSSEEYKEE